MSTNYDINQKQVSTQNLQNSGNKKPVANNQKTKSQSSIFSSDKNTNKTSTTNSEAKALGLKNNKGAGTKIKSQNGTVYTVVGEANNGRKIVMDSKGQLQVMSHDNIILKKSYVTGEKEKPKSTPNGQKSTISTLKKQLNTAQKSFDAQLKDDGWAADVADGVSNIWGAFQKEGNQAWRVRKDLEAQKKNVADLEKAAQKSEAAFNAKFKQIYGVEYNEQAIANYNKNPNEQNYKKAFGSKHNITKRVENYNSSQKGGAEVVKTTTKVAAGVAVGVATGGTGFVALGTVAAATAATSFAVDTSDRLSSKNGLKEGELKEIAKNAAWDGASVLAGGAVGKVAGTVVKGTTKAAIAGRAAINVTGDTALGAAREYAETGEITTKGVVHNALMSGVGSAVGHLSNKVVKGTTKTDAIERVALDTAGDTAAGAVEEYVTTGDISAQGLVQGALIKGAGTAIGRGSVRAARHVKNSAVVNNTMARVKNSVKTSVNQTVAKVQTSTNSTTTVKTPKPSVNTNMPDVESLRAGGGANKSFFDRKISIDELMKEQATIRKVNSESVSPKTNTTSVSTEQKPVTRSTTQTSSSSTPQQVNSEPVPKQTASTNGVTQPISPKVQNGTSLNSTFNSVAKTADGTPINARVNSATGNVEIMKNGTIHKIPLGEVCMHNDGYPIHESSTGNYLIIQAGKDGNVSITSVKAEETSFSSSATSTPSRTSAPKPEAPTTRPTSGTQNSVQTTKPASTTEATPVAKKPASALPIPAGFKEDGEVMGRRRIIGPDNVVMYESKGTWRQLN